ncbi:hypothetical protein [Nocardioides sp.]|jgi:hypothetical protein|uniref:hypothetical protein n=1 Tax=Nocardioides sp. TaxID=35761 RepID=UPI002F41BC47
MTPTGSRSLSAAVLALALLATPVATSYAAERPHTHDEYVAHTRVVGAPTPFPVSGLGIGDAPRIAYAFASEPGFGDGNWLLRRTDGTSLRLPRLTWGVWAPMGDGAIGMAGTEAGPELQQVSGTGGVRSRLIEHFGLGVSPDHEIVGWLGDHGSPHVVEGGGTRRSTMPRVAHGNVLTTVSGTNTCKEQEPEGGGCTVFVNGERHVWVSTSHGIVGTAGPMLAVSDVSARGRVAGLVSRRTDDHRACFGVFRADGHRVFKTCHYYVDTFSLDGRRVLAERSQVQWASVRRLAILGHDGHVVRSWTFAAGRNRSLSQLTWEDSHHLLGVLLVHEQWGLVRIGTDGTVEYAGPPVDATGEFAPYNLPLR